MKKSGIIAVGLVFALSLLAGCGGGMVEGSGDISNGISDQSEWEDMVASINALESQVAAQQRKIDALQDILSMVSEHLVAAEKDIAAHDGRLSIVESNNALMLDPYLAISLATINGLIGPHVILTGANLHIRSGSAETDATVNGVGNLLVGYNEEPTIGTPLNPGDRGGSHNLIVGPGHRYSNYGGFVAGILNTVSGSYSSVSGGSQNTASDYWSSVSGGSGNTASDMATSVSGGYSNTASFESSSVSGGQMNEASFLGSSISGGFGNTASGSLSSICGGVGNTASGGSSSISGGQENTASGDSANVNGGYQNTAGGQYATVGGGWSRTASGQYDWAAGSLWEDD
ncbi:MAG: hypothetical protein JSU92_14020 [Deltaproteobacteria bacterium]|nr:MAG: hypothetical protein JSU92_14020 [Deltaproteobacteria bacterium]